MRDTGHRGKADLLIWPDAQRDERAIGSALRTFDEVYRQMNVKWGNDRLPALVPPEVASRFGIALSHMDEVIDERDVAKSIAAIENAIRGLNAMDRIATETGAQPADSSVVEYDLDGFRFAILKDEDAWPAVRARDPELQTYTMREIAVILKAHMSPAVAAVKQTFGGAQVIDYPARSSRADEMKLQAEFWEAGGDPIPF